MERARWNHNIHYHRWILDRIPDGATTALDVGTGDGLLALDMSDLVASVSAIDVDPHVLAKAREESQDVTWIHGDVMTYPFATASFDVVASIATLHHLPDLEAVLTRLADLAAPGGLVSAVGLARSSTASDLMMDAAGAVQNFAMTRRKTVWEHSAPTVWPPPHSYTEVHAIARRVLPGVEWRRLPMWRYGLAWIKN